MPGGPHMLLLLTLALLITATVVGSRLRVRVPRSRSSPHLGRMSERWLTEHYAAHSA